MNRKQSEDAKASEKSAARQDARTAKQSAKGKNTKDTVFEKSAAGKNAAPAMAMPAANLLFQAPDLSSYLSAPAADGEAPKRNAKSSKNHADAEKGASRGAKNTRNAKDTKDAPDTKDKDSRKASAKNNKKAKAESVSKDKSPENTDSETTTRRRRRRERPETSETDDTQVKALEGSTRLEAKRIRRKVGRKENRRRTPITEAEFLARRENVKREMVVREKDNLNQVAILEDGMLVEHYVSRHTQTTAVGNIYLGKVQNVLSSMEAAFVDIGKGRNAVLYAGEVNWDAVGLNAKTGKIEEALSPGDLVMVQVTKDPIGHKGARLTSQITLAGRHLVLVPSGAMTGISRKLPEAERIRLKGILRELIPSDYGVIVRTAAEGATEEQLRNDVERLTKIWEDLSAKQKRTKNGPVLLHGEPELAVRVVRDIFNEDFASLTIQGDTAWKTISKYVKELSPELTDRLSHWRGSDDIFAAHRIDEQLAKGFERKVWLPSGGYLIIDRTEAMTVIDVNTGRYIGTGGTLEETVTKNNLEAAEEIVRQLRLRDIGGIVVIDFVDMVIESNRDLVLRRLVECLGRDRTRHQVTEITSLGLVQMTRKRVGQGLVEAFSTTCECCEGRGFIVHDVPVENNGQAPEDVTAHNTAPRRGGTSRRRTAAPAKKVKKTDPEVRQTMAAIATAAHQQDDDEDTGTVDSTPEAGKVPAAKTPPEQMLEIPAGAAKPALGAANPVLEIAPTPRRKHRRAASTGVINTDSSDPDIVVSND